MGHTGCAHIRLHQCLPAELSVFPYGHTAIYYTAPYFSACLPIYPWSRTDTLNSHLLLYQFAHLAIQSCGHILYTTHLLTHVAL